MRKTLFILLALILPSLTMGVYGNPVNDANAWKEIYPEIEKSIASPDIARQTVCITKYGANPDNDPAKNQKAINKAIKALSAKGGGKVTVPPGRFLTGAITLKSGVNIEIDKDAVLEFVFEPELYPIVRTRWEGVDCYNLQPCIYAFGATDIAITGQGTIDGGGSNDTWWSWCGAPKYGWKDGMVSQRNGARANLLKMSQDGIDMSLRRFNAGDGLRPQLINLVECDRILIEDVTLLRSPFWVIHPLLSSNITVRGVTINNDGPNGDGCDPESCNGVLIEKCRFNTGDDCIAIKSGRNADGRLWMRPSQNIIVRNCEMRNGHGGVVIGSEISGGCNNVFIENNTMDSPNLDRVIRIKTNTCRGGVIENIYARNIEVGQCRESVLKINLDYERNEICCRGFLPVVRNINLNNVNCRKSMYGVQIIALDTCVNVYDINIDNCRFDNVAKGNTITGKVRDINFNNLYINGSLTFKEKPYQHYSQWMARSEMKRQPKSFLLDFSKKPKWSYVMGIELESMLDTYRRYGGDDILDYCKMYIDTIISDNGNITGYRLEDYNLDQVRTGRFVASMHALRPHNKTAQAIATLISQMQRQPRTEEGVYWHKAIYAWQVWLDGIFMGLPFSIQTASDFLTPPQASAVYDDAVDQVLKTYSRTLDSTTGLNRHAWDETRLMFWADKESGLSEHCWGRAQGWFTMALIEILDYLPLNHHRRDEVIGLLQKVLGSVMRWQDKDTGLWFQVMDAPGQDGNYLEATASSMFAYSLLKAYRKGYVEGRYRDAGIKAYRGIINRFIRVNPDNTISLTDCCSVAGLGPGDSDKVRAAAPNVKENRRRDGSYSYYLSEKRRDNDAKGIGPFIWASLEMERLGYNTDNISQPIDRMAVVSRNNPIITTPDTLASLTVGNGNIAATVDFTGMQSFPQQYRLGVPLTTMSDWGWHSFPNPDSLQHHETLKSLNLGHGHDEIYAVEFKDGSRRQKATQYFRANPHRLNLGLTSLEIIGKDSMSITPDKFSNIHQELKLWDGKIESTFTANGHTYEVTTACMPDRDCIFYRIKSNGLESGRTRIALRFPYPTGAHSDDAADWDSPGLHTTQIIDSGKDRAVIQRTLDNTTYYVSVRWEGNITIDQRDAHTIILTPLDNTIAMSVEYASAPDMLDNSRFEFDQANKTVMKRWPEIWRQGGIVDFAQCTDPRASELERRVVLSQYNTIINASGSTPPQETGLVYNSWFGRPHLEMTWWHAVDHALWNRPRQIARLLDWYIGIASPKAREIAARQGFKGIRWMKMTDNEAGEAPSNTGSFLIWQQPHFIYLAEEVYRSGDADAIGKYGEAVEATAEFMTDYARACDTGAPDILLHGNTAMQESMSKDFSYAHPFEQAYWRYGLEKSQQWRQRRGMNRDESRDSIIARLSLPSSKLPTSRYGQYSAGLPTHPFENTEPGNTFNPYIPAEIIGGKKISEEDFHTKSHSDHPAVLGVCCLPYDISQYDRDAMNQTLDHVTSTWQWHTTWGWDYGMIAMAAARLGRPDKAIDALMMNQPKNIWLPNGHNYQDQRLRIYLPGNGSLLDAIALMCAGWDGCEEISNPGFPNDGTWNVRWEGLERMQ